MIVVEIVLNCGVKLSKEFNDLEMKKAIAFERRFASNFHRCGKPKSFRARAKSTDLYIDLSAEYLEVEKIAC